MSADTPPRVGYKSPPVAHRFAKGQSGNPKGRPRKAKAPAPQRRENVFALAADLALLEEAYRPVQIREGDRVVTLPALHAVFRSATVAAMKGDRFARKLLADSVRDAEARHSALLAEQIDNVSKYQQRAWDAIRSYTVRGLPPPSDILPHPDDIVIRPDGTPDLVGPSNPNEKAWWDERLQAIADSDEEIAFCRAEARRTPKHAAILHDDLAHEKRIKAMLVFATPDERTRRRPGYRLPTRDEMRAAIEQAKRDHPLLKELTPDEQERAIEALIGKVKGRRVGGS